MAEAGKWRRRFKRLAITLAIGFALIALAFFFLPLPIGWAINLGAKRALPPALGMVAHVDSGTFRWRVGNATARIEIAGIATSVKGHPLASVGGIVVEVDKSAAWHGYYAPRLVAVSAPQLVVDTTAEGAFTALQSAGTSSAAAPAPQAPPALITFAPALPAPGDECRVRVENLRVDYLFPGMKWSVAGGLEATVARAGDDIHAEAAANLGTREHPISGTLKADVSLRTGKIGFAISLPEFRTLDLPPLPTGKLPIEATLALAAAGEVDYATRALMKGSGEFSLRDGQLSLPGIAGPPIALQRIIVRGKATPRDGGLWAELEQGALTIEGASINVRKLEASIAQRSRVTWDADVADFAGARLTPRLPDVVRQLAPWLPKTLDEFNLARFGSKGEALIERNATGALAVLELEADQSVKAKLADELFDADFSARQRTGGPIEAKLHLAPFTPGKFARALPAEWPLAAVAFPIGVDATVHASPAGELLDADLRVEAGSGELRAMAVLPMTVPIRRVVMEARVREKGARFEIPTCTVDTALGRLDLSEVVASHERLEARISGRVVVSGIEAVQFEKMVPVPALVPLREAGLALADFALRRCSAEFSANLKSKTGTDWLPAKADVVAEVEVGFAGKPIGLQLSVKLPEGASEATARLVMKEFRPADFGPRMVAGVELGDFRFPVAIEAEARLGATDAKLRSASLRARVGAGEARIAQLKTTLPLRGASFEGSFDPEKNVAHASFARLQLAPGIEAGVEDVDVALAPALRVTGTAKIAPLVLRDALAWWPKELFPDMRRQADAAVIGGKLQAEGIQFELAAQGDKGAIVPKKVAGSVALRALSTRPPGMPATVEVEEAKLTLDYPRAEVQVKSARTPGFVIESAGARIADVMAARPAATARAKFTLDVVAAKPWLELAPPAARALVAETTGKLSGDFEASAPLDAVDFSGAKMKVVLATEKLSVPGFFDGPLEATIEAAAPTKTTFTVGGKVAITDAKLMKLERRPNLSPFSLNATLTDWLGGDAPKVELAFSADDFSGLPLRLKAAAQFANSGQAIARAELQELVFGRTELHGEWRHVADQREMISISSPRVDVGELTATAAPWLSLISPPPPAKPAPPKTATTAALPPAVATRPAGATVVPASLKVAPAEARPPAAVAAAPVSASAARTEIKMEIASVEFGQWRQLRGLSVEAALENDWPQTAKVSATEGTANAFALELTPAGAKQRVKLAIANIAALAQTLTEPLRNTKLPAGNLADAAASAARIPVLIAGGTLGIEGELARDAGGISAKGSFLLTDATMIRAPYVLQLLALKSRKDLERNPLIRKLSVGEWSYDPESVAVKTFALEGSGLIDRVKLNSVRYAFAGEKLAVDGEYFGVGFEVVGTRSDPQVFLKENKVIRAIGQRNEFDVFFDDTPPAAPKKK